MERNMSRLQYAGIYETVDRHLCLHLRHGVLMIGPVHFDPTL